MVKKIIVSMTTIPSRKERLKENIFSILNQSVSFDKLVINIDDNLSKDDYKWYKKFAKISDKIIFNKASAKWRSCNKLLPTLLLFPDDVIITIDDDVYYPVDCFKYLLEQHTKTPGYIVSHEVNPILIENNFITYLNSYDIKVNQFQWGKYLSNCCLFPPHVFDGTDLMDYDKMMACTKGTHDELWFWVNSTLNKVKCVGLNYIRTFAYDVKRNWSADEYRLTHINEKQDSIDDYMKEINKMYGTRLIENINNDKVVFVLNKDNVGQFCASIKYIKLLYSYGFSIKSDGLTSGWIKTVEDVIDGSEFKY